MGILIDYCEGCDTYSGNKEDCAIDNKDGSCPCCTCIVKVMCQDACDEWSKWYAEDY